MVCIRTTCYRAACLSYDRTDALHENSESVQNAGNDNFEFIRLKVPATVARRKQTNATVMTIAPSKTAQSPSAKHAHRMSQGRLKPLPRHVAVVWARVIHVRENPLSSAASTSLSVPPYLGTTVRRRPFFGPHLHFINTHKLP